jgi:DNA invertase Pin-like site-specific DNA recombinase
VPFGADCSDDELLVCHFGPLRRRMKMKLTRARTLAGLERARAAGKKLGRPRLDDGSKPAGLLTARARGASCATLAEDFGISQATIRRRWREAVRAQEVA